jgi:hypothetical protein
VEPEKSPRIAAVAMKRDSQQRTDSACYGREIRVWKENYRSDVAMSRHALREIR